MAEVRPLEAINPARSTPVSSQKLGQLTSLRFIAAVMVVLCHCGGKFGIREGLGLDGLATSVSFFFALSGFILAYVYPTLPTRREVTAFLRARVARIWPAHLATFVLAIELLGLRWDTPVALRNVFMVHAWNPQGGIADYFSYNAPSWSISTEFFFYLAFPLLIYRWPERWRLRTLLSGVLLLSVIAYVNCLHPHDRGASWLYFNPLTRIFEFVLGMSTFTAYQACRSKFRWTRGLATTLELAAIACCALSVYFVPYLARSLEWTWTGPGLSCWLEGSGSVFAYCLLILVFAIGRGAVSEFLARPGCVLLGEISYSIYLLHSILLRYYAENMVFLPRVPNPVAFAVFWALLLIGAYVMWSWLEIPARRWIAGRRPARADSRSGSDRRFPNRANILAGAILACLVLAFRMEIERVRTTAPPPGSAESRFRTSALGYRVEQAVQAGDSTGLEWLLDSGIDPNLANRDTPLPLVQASWFRRREAVSILLAHHANPDTRGPDGLTPFMVAANRGDTWIVRSMVAAGASIDTRRTSDGATPLMIAAWKGDRAMADLLVSLGANVNAVAKDGGTALGGAASQGHIDIVTNLARHQASVDGHGKDGQTPLMVAAWTGNLAMVNTLLSLGANVNAARTDGSTALIDAAQTRHAEIADALLRYGALVDAGKSDGTTALMIAAWNGDRPLVELLLSAGADAGRRRADGDTALDFARMANHGAITELLADRKSGAHVPPR